MRGVVVGAVLVMSTLVMPPVSPVEAVPVVRCAGRVATIVGTPGPDRLWGTSGNDVIAALGGRDRVHGREGDDVVCGGDGPDHLYGGRGDDELRGQGSRDLLLGIAGDDRLYGGRDAVVTHADGTPVQGDTLVPGPGRDYVDAGFDRRQGPLAGDVERPDDVNLWMRQGGVTVRDLGGPRRLGSVADTTVPT